MGETNEAFYSNIYTGQALPRQPRPPRPPPPRLQFHHHINDERGVNSQSSSHPQNETDNDNRIEADDDGGGGVGGPSGSQPWFCNMCTFQNHPLLNKCEQCEMPLLTTSGTSDSFLATSRDRQLTNASMQQQQQQRPLQSAPPIVQNPFRYTNNTAFRPETITTTTTTTTVAAAPSSAGVVHNRNTNLFPRLTQNTN